MRRWFLPPATRFLVRGMYFGVVIGVGLGLVIAFRFAGASLRGRLPLWFFAGLVAILFVNMPVMWITKSPKEEPDWNAVAARHRRLASALLIGGFAASVLGFLLLGAFGVVAWCRPSFSDHWSFFAALLLAFGGLLVAMTGQRILDAGKRAGP